MAVAQLELEINASGASRSINNVKKSLKGVETAAKKADKAGRMTGLQKSANGAAQSFSRLKGAVIGVVGAIGGIKAFTAALSELDGLAKLADQAGISTDRVQSLKFAFGQAGIEAGTFGMGVKAFNKRLGQAREGTGAAKKEFERFGIALKNADGSFRSNEEVMDQYLRELAKLPDSTAIAGSAVMVFGDEFGKLLPTALKGGIEGLSAAEKKARDFGLVLDEGALRKAEETSDALDLLGQVIKTQFLTAVSAMLPTIKELTDKALAALPGILETVGAGIKLVADNMDLLVIVAGALIGAKALGGVITTVTSLTPLMTALFAIIAANPITALVTAVTALTAGLAYFFTQTETGQAIVDGFFGALGDAVSFVGDLADGAVKKFTELVDYITGPVGAAIDSVTGFFSGMYDAVFGNSFVPDMIDGVKKEFGKLDQVMVQPSAEATQNVNSQFGGLGAAALPSAGGGSSFSTPGFTFNIANVTASGGATSEEDLMKLARGIMESAQSMMIRESKAGGVLNV